MEKNNSELSKAERFYLELRLQDAYTIFRRFYDRLPFKPEPDHARYLGMFVRTLYELGKSQELQFYSKTLEKHYFEKSEPEIGFQLAYVYCDPSQSQLKTALKILEEIIKQPLSDEIKTKAKLCLAYCYDEIDGNLGAVRKLLESIEKPSDQRLNNLVSTWHLKLLIDEKRFEDAEKLLNTLLDEISVDEDWWSYFLIRINRAKLLILREEFAEAELVVSELKGRFSDKPLKSFKYQLDYINQLLYERRGLGVITIAEEVDRIVIKYRGKLIEMKHDSAPSLLLDALFEKKTIDKNDILSIVYSRPYRGIEDDKFVYYQIYNLRKQLGKVGLPVDAISHDDRGYLLVPEIRRVKGEV